MVLLAGKVSSPQSGELSIVRKKIIEIASDNHVQIDVKFTAWDWNVEESHLSPPSLPSFFQLLYLYIRVQVLPVVSKTVESDFPSGVFKNTCIELVDIVRIVASAPFDSQNRDLSFLFRNLMILRKSPRVDG
jgi:hypothetical protein